ncbi:Zinc uptake regulation protein [Serratia symbiotica]|nr:Zinc uptake regulation protein [Serratia symbiotica]
MTNLIIYNNLLTKAKKICQQRNARLTPQRQKVLRIMLNQFGSISAYNLLDLLRISEPKAKPSTIYRALDFLLDQGFIHKVESTNSYTLCHHFGKPMHTSILFICNHCNKVTDFTTKGIEKILQKLAEYSRFTLHHSIIEAHGLCIQCIQIKS